MLPIHTILHPTDFSDRSEHALRVASSLARDYHARLIVLHVMAPSIMAFGEGVVPPDSEDLRAEAQQELDRLHVDDELIHVERRIAEGDPATVILHFAQELPADVIVIGSHGRTGLGRMLMGSTAEQISRRASCPVLTVTHPFPATPQEEHVGAVGLATI
jgi:nucleotide-binding universal stress UspA family protein